MKEHVDIQENWKMELVCDEVIPGQLIAVKNPPVAGAPGLTVTGEELLPQTGKDISIILGKNTYASEDGLRIYSAAFGKVRWKGNRVDVEKELEIDKDVDEDIDFDGRVKISGGVSQKLKVVCTGDITIAGGVTEAEINSGGSVEIKQEIRNATITAEEDIISASVRESSLQAKGDILIEGGLLACKVDGHRVICSGRKGIIAGGTVSAKKEINAMAIGSERTSIQTEIKIHQGGCVSVKGILYPKVKMILGRRSMIVKRVLKRITLKADPVGITTIEYQNPQTKQETQGSQITKPKIENLKLPPSVLVHAESLEEAKRKAVQLLNIFDVGLNGEMIDEFIWQVFPKGVILPREEEEFIDIKMPLKDSSFKFENRQDGLYLYITGGTGKKVNPEDVFCEIQKQGFIGIDASKVIEACKTKSQTITKIGVMQFTKDIGGEVKIDISDDGLKAYFTIIYPQNGELMIGPENVIAALKKKGVIVGIKEDVIIAAFQNKEFGKPILVAEAILPQDSPNAQVIYKIGK